MIHHEEKIRHAWNQSQIPVVIRRTGKGEKNRVRLPYAPNNRDWLQDGRSTKPLWIKDLKYWETPKLWFNDFVERALKRYKKVYIIQPYRAQEKCAAACMNAVGHICQCSCMGANHGMGNDGSWFEVGEAFATRWMDEEWACRLLQCS